MLLKRTVLITGALLLCVSGLWAGDSASFVDLGFSSDGRAYMFGQFGVLSPSLKPWAELFVIDVPSNAFVPSGKVAFTQDSPIKAGQDGAGVLYRLISGNSALVSRNGIDFQNQGQPLYVSLATNLPERGETIKFRDFAAKKEYTANLISATEGSGQSVKTSFYINLESRSEAGQAGQAGQFKNYTIGSSYTMRPKVIAYNIKKVLVDARGSSLVFVIQMKCADPGGHSIRYMVETLRLSD
jgi:predicted secreted protein